MRKTYKFSSSACQGGYLYAHKTQDGVAIRDKEKLRDALKNVSQQFKLIDVTIKVYDSIFFFFYMARPSIVPEDIIESIQNAINAHEKFDRDYVYNAVYDLQEKYVREDFTRFGFSYDEG